MFDPFAFEGVFYGDEPSSSSDDEEDYLYYISDPDEEDKYVHEPNRGPHFVGNEESSSRTELGESAFQQLSSFMCSEELSDVTVKVGGETFPCHKIILSVWCSYFRALFSSGMLETTEGMVELSTLEVEEFRTLLQVMYSGQLTVTDDNLEGLIFGAAYLQCKLVQKGCTDYMINRLNNHRLDNPEKTFLYLKICRTLGLEDTAHDILDFMMPRFEKHMNCADFADLTVEDIEYIVSSQKLQYKLTEDELCYAILTWFSVGLEERKKHLTKIMNQIRYLALSESFMKDTFLDHPVLLELDAKYQAEIRTDCLRYLGDHATQEVIGVGEARHRNSCHLKDVVVVLYCSKFICIMSEVLEGQLTSTSTMSLPLPVGLTQQPKQLKTVTACNYGRTEMYVSSGSSFFHFSGISGEWKKLASSSVQKSRNCLVLHNKTDTIYSVTSRLKGVFIEKFPLSPSGGGSRRWSTDVCGAYSMKNKTGIEEDGDDYINSGDKFQSWSRNNRTCAYIVQDNIYLLHTTDTYQWDRANTAVLRYSPELQTLSYITCLPIIGTCIAAVHFSNLVFLVDQDCKSVLRIDSDGASLDLYGEIGHDTQDSNIHLPSHSSNFSVVCWDGKLVIPGFGEKDNRYYNQRCVTYDLDSHCTGTLQNSKFTREAGSAHAIKLTIDKKHLRSIFY